MKKITTKSLFMGFMMAISLIIFSSCSSTSDLEGVSCGLGFQSKGDQCICLSNEACGKGAICNNGQCITAGCKDNRDCCPERASNCNLKCNHLSGKCLGSSECQTDLDCSAADGFVCDQRSQSCNNNVCLKDGDCPLGRSANGQQFICYKQGNSPYGSCSDQYCTRNDNCPPNQICNKQVNKCQNFNPASTKYCVACSSPLECGMGGLCEPSLSPQTNTSRCAVACNPNADECPSDYTCAEILVQSLFSTEVKNFCIPNGTAVCDRF